MNNKLTDITLVVDRSGSMEQIRTDAEGGINALIKEQTEQGGECTLTLVQFDDQYEFVEEGTPIKEVKAYTLRPRGRTALLDAVGQSIARAKVRIEALPEDEKPGLVMMVIVTDGFENSSREFNRDQVRALITEMKADHDWQFSFLGADEDAFQDAVRWGVNVQDSAVYGKQKSANAYSAVSGLIRRRRDIRSLDASADVSLETFTSEELDSLSDDSQPTVS